MCQVLNGYQRTKNHIRNSVLVERAPGKNIGFGFETPCGISVRQGATGTKVDDEKLIGSRHKSNFILEAEISRLSHLIFTGENESMASADSFFFR